MVITVIGLQNLDFVTSQGTSIKGVNVFAKFSDENIQGFRTEKFFIAQDIALPKGGIQIDDTLDLIFNYKGKIEKINRID